MAWLQRVALGLVLLLLALLAMRQVSSPDVGFHLAAGNRVLAGHGWPVHDPFTYTVSDHRYLDTTWGYQVLLALVERASGAPGMVLLHVALVLALFSLVTCTARLVPGELRVLLPLLLLGGLAAEPRFQTRPEILSYALLALVLYLLHRHAEGLGSPLWLLPPVFLFWTNAHGLFVLGWVAMACFVAGSTLRRRRLDLPLLGWCLLSMAVGLVNPYGWRALTFPLTLGTRMSESNVFSGSIGEFGSPLGYLLSDQLMFYVVPLASFFALALLAGLGLPSLWRQKRFSAVFLVLAYLPLALVMIRNVPVLAVACIPGAVWGLSLDRVLDAMALRGALRRRLRHVFLGGVLLVVVVLAVRVCTDAYYVSGRRLERFGLGWNELPLPVEATRYARDAGLPGRVLNHLNFGGYLIWALGEPVFIDGRLEVMGETFFEEYREALATPAGLQRAVQRYGIGWIVFPHRLRPDLVGGLTRHPGWRLAYVDHLAAIFVARDAAVEPDESARRVGQPATPVDVDSLPGLGGPGRRGPAARWLAGLFRRASYPARSFGLGWFQFNREDYPRAADAFAAAIRESGGDYYEMYEPLGDALLATGRAADARKCYRVFLEASPYYRRAARQRVASRLAEIDARLRTN